MSRRIAWLAIFPVAIALTAVGWMGSQRNPAPPPAAEGPLQPAPTRTISDLSPRELADELFNLVMAANEQGDTARIAAHGPMALQAYASLASLTADGQYHVGMIHAALGDPDQALEQAELLFAERPDHLLGIVLSATVADAAGDQTLLEEWTAKFVAAYDGEMATSRQEYLEHAQGLEGFRQRILNESG